MRKKCARPTSQSRREPEPTQTQRPTNAPRRVVRFPALRDRVQLSRSTIWRLIQKDEFPKPIRLTGGHAVGWIEAHVDEWLQKRCGE